MPVTPVIPNYITVHLGPPNSNAPNVRVPFTDYIKNVASSEIYPSWPESAIRANILAQISFALNRVYFTGDKRLDSTLRSMPYCPVSLLENLPFLLQASDDKDRLQAQYDILKNVIKELGERIENGN